MAYGPAAFEPVQTGEEVDADDMGLLDGARVPGATRLGRAVLRRRDRSGGSAVSCRLEIARPEDEGHRGPAEAAREGPGALGALPRPGAGRARVRSAQARAPQRGVGTAWLGAGDLRHAGPRHRKHGDPRRARLAGAEGALALP